MFGHTRWIGQVVTVKAVEVADELTTCVTTGWFGWWRLIFIGSCHSTTSPLFASQRVVFSIDTNVTDGLG